MLAAWDTIVIFSLIGYELAAVASQKTKRKFPLITTILMRRKRWQRWSFIGAFSVVLAAHFHLVPLP